MKFRMSSLLTFKKDKPKVSYGPLKPHKPLSERRIIKDQISKLDEAGNSSVVIFRTINSVNPDNMAVNYSVIFFSLSQWEDFVTLLSLLRVYYLILTYF